MTVDNMGLSKLRYILRHDKDAIETDTAQSNLY